MPWDKDIDVIGKACPMPLVTLAKIVRGMVNGETVRIRGNDPIFEESIVEFCRERGVEILETTREGKIVTMGLKVCSEGGGAKGDGQKTRDNPAAKR